jgi:hypothetical protein
MLVSTSRYGDAMNVDPDLGPGDWYDRQVFLPAGHQFGDSQTSGLDSSLTFIKGQKGTQGPAVMRDPIPQQQSVTVPEIKLPANMDPKTVAVALGAFALGVITTVVVVKNRHRIKAWWEDKALPRLTLGAIWFFDLDDEYLKALKEATETVGEIPTEQFSNEVAVVVEDLRENMTNEEARRRVLLIMMAASIISKNLRELKDARIQDEDFHALQEAMGYLTTEDVVDRLNRILESDPAVLDDETRAIFVKVFGGGEVKDGLYQPLSLDAVEEALRLPGDDDDPEPVLANA